MFCQKCGTKLVDNAAFCAGCGAPISKEPVAQASYVMNPQPQQVVEVPKAPPKPNELLLYLKRMLHVVIEAIKKPATATMDYAKTGDEKIALGFIGLQSIAIMFYILSVLLVVFIKARYTLYYMDIPIIGIIMTSLILSFGISCLFPVLLMVCNHQVFKDEVSYKKMLCVVGAGTIPVTAALAIALVLGFLVSMVSLALGIAFGLFIISIGVLLSFYFTGAALKGVSKLDDDKQLYVLFFSMVVIFAVTVILLRIAMPLYTPGFNFFRYY